MADEESLEWGALPLERYVLMQWRSHPEQDLDIRRSRLARGFVGLGQIGRLNALMDWQKQTLPPHNEWKDILAPLRSPAQRVLARPTPDLLGSIGFGVIWLRTNYNEDSNDVHAKMVQEVSMDLALEQERNVLDDEGLYAYGDDWPRIFDVIPERLLNIPSEVEDSVLDGERRRNEGIQSLQRELSGEDFNDDAYRRRIERLHSWSCANYLFVADKTAMETGEVLVVFFDDCGRVVRTSRAQPYVAEELSGAWFEGEFNQLDEFSGAEIGVDYRPGGQCGPPFNT